ncbi:MAG TPA: class I SAM-dependent methyltransferase [Sphingomicrobium sp.]|jgi:malonyl-CoA O-methyltransferase
MKPLRADEGYSLWAATYSDETAISYLENKLVTAMTPPLAGLRLLDAGCGTGRRLRTAGAASATGLEPSREMVASGILNDGPIGDVEIVPGDVRDMPLQDGTFDVVWCRLVLGHLPSIERAYAELARVADHGATVIVSDFHPAAVDAGHRRTFRVGPRTFELEHYIHRQARHISAAQTAGLGLRQVRDAAIGNDVRGFYQSAGRLDAYPDHCGLPVVLALSFRKER